MAQTIYQFKLYEIEQTKIVQFKTGNNEQTRLQLKDDSLILFQWSGVHSHSDIYKEYHKRYCLYNSKERKNEQM